MVTTIQFNNEFFTRRTEVYNVISDGVLVSKMDISHAMRPQMCPEFGFWFGHFAVKLFCAPEDFWCGAFMHKTLTPSALAGISPH